MNVTNLETFTQFLLTTNAGLLTGIIVTLWRMSLTLEAVKTRVKTLEGGSHE